MALMNRGVIISIDAITALSIVILVFSTFYLTVSAEQSHVATLKYAYLMAADTLNVLDTVTCSSLPASAAVSACGVEENTLLAALISANSQADRDDLMVYAIDPIIPEQYGYLIEAYSPVSNNWVIFFNTSAVNNSRHDWVREQKARSSAEKVITVLIDEPSKEDTVNPYCYSSCSGADDPATGSRSCAFPCVAPSSNTLIVGNNSILLVRVSVYI